MSTTRSTRPSTARRPGSRSPCTRTARPSRWTTTAAASRSTCMPKFKKPALEMILTTLHAGGKFEGKNYALSGGLHGVGASVVNALERVAGGAVKRDGEPYEQSFARGKPTGKLKKVGGARGTGTAITFRPDAEIFGDKLKFDAGDRARAARGQELPAPRAEGRSSVTRPRRRRRSSTFQHETASPSTCTKLVADRGKRRCPAAPPASRASATATCASSWRWCGPRRPTRPSSSYVNGIPTPAGGTHENGLKAGAGQGDAQLHRAPTSSAPKGVTITAEDIREGVVAILSVYVAEPQFQGQTKDRLNNPEVAGPGRRPGAAGARAVAQREPDRGRGGRRAHHPGGAGARGVARRRRRR